MSRIILHCDLNNFYASVECLHHPEWRGRPVAVCGRQEARHGIVLAKNMQAKGCGVKTGETIWQARQKCPDLLVAAPHPELYLRYSGLTRAIMNRYSDRVEPFGIDEAWLDVTRCPLARQAGGPAVADDLRRRIREELGLTASVGVADNKIFAKLASDLRKPDATTVITQANYRAQVFPLPVEDLLYVGPATRRKLNRTGVYTIGELARCQRGMLRGLLGKWGETLWVFANGLDREPVAVLGDAAAVKSVGNSITTARDLTCEQDARIILYALAESVAERLRLDGLEGTVVQLWVRDNALQSLERPQTLRRPTAAASDLAAAALELLRAHAGFDPPLRALGVRACGLIPARRDTQLSLLEDRTLPSKQQRLEQTIDDIRRRFGHFALQRGVMLTDPALSSLNPVEDHVIHPVPYFDVRR